MMLTPMPRRASLLLATLLTLAGTSPLTLAESCSVGETVGDMKQIDIDGTDWFVINRAALTEFAQLRKDSEQVSALREMTGQLKTSLNSCLGLVTTTQTERDASVDLNREYSELADKYAALQKKYEALNQRYEATLDSSVSLARGFEVKADELVDLTRKYDDHIDDWRDHAQECRDIASSGSNSGIHFDLGVGATEGDSNAAALIGVGFGNLKAWGFLQNQNSGLLLGTSVDF